MMANDDDILHTSFEDIIKRVADSEKTKNKNRLSELRIYENRYLLKSDKNGFPSYYISDKDILDIYDNIVFDGLHRYYKEDLSKRDFSLESSSPHTLRLCNTEINENAWGNLLCKAIKLMLENFPQKRQRILTFRTTWGNAEIFSTRCKTNYKIIDDNLYFNCNHTSQHLCWLLQDLFDYFEIDKMQVELLVHRSVVSEPKDIKEHIGTVFIMGFKSYICREYNVSEDMANKVVKNIENVLNPMLAKQSISDDNFFLFDDIDRLTACIKKVCDYVNSKTMFTEKSKRTISKCFKYLRNFYKL